VTSTAQIGSTSGSAPEVGTLLDLEVRRQGNMVGKSCAEADPKNPRDLRQLLRPPRFDPEDYTQRNVVERCINKHKQFRVVATRYDKREYIFAGTVDVASIRIWLRDPTP
jgi:transposase